MTKFKKITAAVVAAVSMASIGMTAFAVSPFSESDLRTFHFDIGDGIYGFTGLDFSDPVSKVGDQKYAEARVESGNPAPSHSEPLYVYITTAERTEAKYRVTDTAEITYVTTYGGNFTRLDYYSGKGIKGNTYYLAGATDEYNLNVTGRWCP